MGGGSPPLLSLHLTSPRLTTCSQLVHSMFTTYSQHVHNMFTTCSWHVHNMFKSCCSTKCSWHVPHMFTTYSPHFHHMFTKCSPHVHHIFTTYSPLAHRMFHIFTTDYLLRSFGRNRPCFFSHFNTKYKPVTVTGYLFWIHLDGRTDWFQNYTRQQVNLHRFNLYPFYSFALYCNVTIATYIIKSN